MKFPIIGNIEQVFTRLVNEGKTTIRFKEPENDLCIHGKLIISRVGNPNPGYGIRPIFSQFWNLNPESVF